MTASLARTRCGARCDLAFRASGAKGNGAHSSWEVKWADGIVRSCRIARPGREVGAQLFGARPVAVNRSSRRRRYFWSEESMTSIPALPEVLGKEVSFELVRTDVISTGQELVDPRRTGR